MPELPEVESVKLQLIKYLVGHKITGVKVNYLKMFTGNVNNLVGAKVKGIRRFAKVLSIDLSNNYSIVIHIKLTGQLIYRGPKLKPTPKLSNKVIGGIPGKHTHAVFRLDKGGTLFYNDVRKFGWIKVVKTIEVETSGFVGKLGPEPFSTLTLRKFTDVLVSTRRAIKVVLMDQSKISGVGNIYANDALWLAGIAPTNAANSLNKKKIQELYKAVLTVLEDGLKRGGASELSFVTPDGQEGKYQNHFLTYGQEGKLCPRCKNEKFVKTKISGRGTYFCPSCQK